MTQSTLEHANITVSNPQKTAAFLCDIFGWHIRWQGEAINGGTTVHVGSDNSYLAVYTPPKMSELKIKRNFTLGALNHVGIVVDDLDATETLVRNAGFKPGQFWDYEPGRRFYFIDGDDVEYEVVSYA